MSNIKVIGLGCCKMVGKDTFFLLLKELNPDFYRFAFADELKFGLSEFCFYLFGKQVIELTPTEKEIFRGVLIAGGKAGREINKDFWVNKVVNNIKCNSNFISVITDVRYSSEYNRLKQEFGDSFIFVNIEREGAPEPTDEEKIHAPELKKLANVNILWETDLSFKTLRPIVKKFYLDYIA